MRDIRMKTAVNFGNSLKKDLKYDQMCLRVILGNDTKLEENVRTVLWFELEVLWATHLDDHGLYMLPKQGHQ